VERHGAEKEDFNSKIVNKNPEFIDRYGNGKGYKI
jgi:hypothetical protein